MAFDFEGDIRLEFPRWQKRCECEEPVWISEDFYAETGKVHPAVGWFRCKFCKGLFWRGV